MAIVNFAGLPTEQVLPASRYLDLLSPEEIVGLMHRADLQAAQAVGRAKPRIAKAVRIIVQAMRAGGKLVFVGAGTSGRLGVIEAAECPPTFGTSPAQIQAIMAGGKRAVFKSQEGSEDSSDAARRQIRQKVRPKDVVVGIAASGVTPFVRGALLAAKGRRAATILITCNPNVERSLAEVVIALSTGPEVLSGSTRLKAGSSCKMVLNMLTTTAMVQLGKVYGPAMVDLQPKSKKLVERGVRLIRQLGNVSEPEARTLFLAAHRRVKTAILMARQGLSYQVAQRKLARAHGFLRRTLS